MDGDAEDIDTSKLLYREQEHVPETLQERAAREPWLVISRYRINDESPEAIAYQEQQNRAAEEARKRKVDAIERMAQILRGLNIEMRVDACGCCGSPDVTFVYRGEMILDNLGLASFDTRMTPAATGGGDCA